MSISIVISTYNRADSLERTLRSIKSYADEIIVIDNESTDETRVVAGRYTKKIFQRPNNKMLNVNKNFGIKKATGDWVLYLDDDEVVTEALAKEIQTVTRTSKLDTHSSQIVGYWIARKNIIFGKWIEHGIWWPDRQMRLFKRDYGLYPEKHVHEYIEVDGPSGTLIEPFIHYNYDSIGQFLSKMQTIYTDSEVNKHISLGYRVNWVDAIRFPVSDFVKLYFAQSGYKDGLHGLVLAGLQSFYSFIVFAKLWEHQKFFDIEITPEQVTHELSRSKREIAYWELTAQINIAKNIVQRIWLKLLRRLYTA